MKQIVVVTGTRSEYGILKPVMERILESRALKLSVLVTGMHLSPEYGLTFQEIENDRMPIAGKVDMLFSSDSSAAMAKGLGIGIYGLTQEMERIAPDIVMILGDRVEAFAGATAGLFSGAVVAHIHGGERTQGGLDEYMRHAITKLSHIHFAATENSRERIIKMGENPDCVFTSGTPGLDALMKYPALARAEISDHIGFLLPESYLLIVQHSVSTHPDTAADEIEQTLIAAKESGVAAILIYPNADAGGRRLIRKVKEYENEVWLKTLVNVPRNIYCNLLKKASVMVGNSSSGIIDAPAFGIPVVNIGERQQNRERGDNVIDVAPHKSDIFKAIQQALYDETFIQAARTSKNPYGDGQASSRILSILEAIDTDSIKAKKRMMY